MPMSPSYTLRNKRVWVAGDRGLVGSALVRRLQREGCEIVTAPRDQVDLRRPDQTEQWLAAAKPQAQLIDPKASQTQIALPMLDTQDRDALRALMDKAAADVVTFRCAVQVQVRQAKDYPFVAALLSARVKKLDPAFKLQISQQLAAEQEPSLQLSPQPKS